ncbi:ACT domain-containing protein, partial [Archangium sp.]|uniref:ACT domain-containing protein n=1 Tax=Archangium sp. TaxID=1872627 RepID=UPI002D5668DE
VEGSWIVSRERAFEARPLMGLACERGLARVELLGMESRPELAAELTGLLAELNVSVDLLSHTCETLGTARADMVFTLPEDDLRRGRQRLEQLVESLGASAMRVSNGLAKVSLVGIGLRSDPGIAAHLCRTLAQQGIAVSGLGMSELRMSCLVDERKADQAICILHEAFGLSVGTPPVLEQSA